MSDLTREYLDKKLDKLATKDDIKSVKSLVQTEVGRLETKIETEVGRLETKMESGFGRLDTKIEHEVAELAGMVSRRFDKLEEKLDVRAEIDELKFKMSKVWNVLNIKN